MGKPRENVHLLPAVTLATIVDRIQRILYFDCNYWDPHKEWDISMLDDINELLHEHGLVPTREED